MTTSEAREYLAEAREGAVSEPRVLRIAEACVAAEEQVEAIRAISQRARRQWRKADYVELEGILGGTGGRGHRWSEVFGIAPDYPWPEDDRVRLPRESVEGAARLLDFAAVAQEQVVMDTPEDRAKNARHVQVLREGAAAVRGALTKADLR